MRDATETPLNDLVDSALRKMATGEWRMILQHPNPTEGSSVCGIDVPAEIARRALSALPSAPAPVEHGELLITPHMLNAGTSQITSPTMDADDKKDLAVKIFRAMIAARSSLVPAPVEGVEPVAWRWRPQGGTVWVMWEAKPVPGGNLVDDAVVEIEPLYSATALERVVKERDEARAKLFPYADATEISGMSWNGFYLIGDKKSIKEVQRLENRSSQLEVFKAAFDERVAAEKTRAEAAEASVVRLTALLAEADEVVKPFAQFAEIHDGPHGLDGGLEGRLWEDSDHLWLRPSPEYPKIFTSTFRAARRYQQKREAK